MEQIKHSHVQVRGVKLHVAEIGTEIWYSWRYQMIAVATAGYRAIAIDCRGYGLSESQIIHRSLTKPHLMTLLNADDVVALLDSLSISKAFSVGKDAGVIPAYMIAAARPEKVAGIITMGVPFMIPGPMSLQIMHKLPKGFYILRWQEPGRAEADFGRFDVKTVIRKIYLPFSGIGLQVAGDDQEIMVLADPSTPLPPWFSEEDLSVYAGLYENSGFRTALQVPYRSKVPNSMA